MIYYIGKFNEPWNFENVQYCCQYCGALLWYEERTIKSRETTNPKFSLCCQDGRVQLPMLKEAPSYLHELIRPNGGSQSSKFRENIRAYNSLFAFTSTGGVVSHEVNIGPGPYVYKISGQNYHRIGSLLPVEGQSPKFAQLYIYDTENELQNRLKILPDCEKRKSLEKNIIENLIIMFDEHNMITQAFRMARDRFKESDQKNFSIRLISNRHKDGRQYNLPTVSEVAALIIGDFSKSSGQRDIIVEHKTNGLQRITELHPSFMAMQYPILFPYGEDGFRVGIEYRDDNRCRHIKRSFVTMREYYAFRIQEREAEGNTLLLGGRLLQQYIVDAFTCIEEERLRWVRLNQPQLRCEVYKGLKDAVVRGDTTPSSIGKRIVLPSSFTGSPRYMIQNFQDAMAICRWVGHPDIFLTFTCNAKWPEIQQVIQKTPGLKVEDRPDIIARVFKIKLDELMKDLRKGHHFGRVIAG